MLTSAESPGRDGELPPSRPQRRLGLNPSDDGSKISAESSGEEGAPIGVPCVGPSSRGKSSSNATTRRNSRRSSACTPSDQARACWRGVETSAARGAHERWARGRARRGAFPAAASLANGGSSAAGVGRRRLTGWRNASPREANAGSLTGGAGGGALAVFCLREIAKALWLHQSFVF